MNRILAVVVPALLAAACTAPRAIYFGDDFSALYRPSMVHAAAHEGKVPLAIRGNPFPDVDAERLAGATVAGMTRAPALWPIRLTTGDPGPRSVDHRFIIAYGEPRLGANGLCAAPDAPFERGERIAATVAFCIGDRLVATVRGRLLETAAMPEDAVFQSFLEGLTGALLPPHNPRLRPCGFLVGC
jgi:hypothetical protein